MSRPPHSIVEPSDDFAGSFAVDVFIQQGWPREDARWLGPLCLAHVAEDGERATELDDAAEEKLTALAGTWRQSGLLPGRDRALLMIYVCLCGCGGRSELGRLFRPADDSLGCDVWFSPERRARRRELAAELRRRGARFEAALMDEWPGEYESGEQLLNYLRNRFSTWEPQPQRLPELVRLMRLLVDDAELDLTRILGERAGDGASHYLLPSEDDPLPPRVPTKVEQHAPTFAVRSLFTWMVGLGPRAIGFQVECFRTWKNDRWGAASACDIRAVIEDWQFWSGSGSLFTPELVEVAQPYLEELEQRCTQVGRDGDADLRRIWLWFAYQIYSSDERCWEALPGERQQAVLRAANEDVAALRKLFSRAEPKPILDSEERDRINRARARTGRGLLPPLSPAEMCQGNWSLLPREVAGSDHEMTRVPWEEFEWERDHFRTCVLILFHLGGVWRGMKPLLLALRALNAPCVAEDLRYWDEKDRVRPPEPWSVIPSLMINLFHSYVGREQATDPELVQLRGELASFCLERLVDRWSKKERQEAAANGRARTDEDMVERSWAWRLCLIRAFSALGLNPEGKGHRTLHTASKIDPHPEVRDAARQAYEKVRRGVTLPDNVSPRRAIVSGLWWMRQAHLLELEVPLDSDGAQRTRIKELTRTKETERNDESAC